MNEPHSPFFRSNPLLLNDAELRIFREQLGDAMARQNYELYPPLPRRTRVRLWFRHKYDAVGIWLSKNHPNAARRWWGI